MSVKKHDFYGKEVTDAIRSACETLKVPQEMLDIEVVETGSTGIFGLIRKKAKIRVSVKSEGGERKPEPQPVAAPVAARPEKPVDVEPEPASEPVEIAEEPEAEVDVVESSEPQSDVDENDSDDDEDEEIPAESEDDAGDETLQIVKTEVARLVELMGFPSSVEVSAKGLSVSCSVKGEFEEELAGPEGKTLDSIQYLVRKIVARKCSERLRISINVGDFRERRLEELKVRAVELAKMVRESGKTQVLPALNPSERREIHMVLQEDKDVRSRSVGDGLFKKILIYKPGKGNRGGRRKSAPRNRRGKGSRNGSSSGEE
jgi:spoIIIJ-associated protein